MNSSVHAVVEVSAEQIILRAGSHWLRFTAEDVTSDLASRVTFRLTEQGTICIGDEAEEEMDMAAERFARAILST